MDNIIIEKTSKTPSIYFDFEANRLEITGVSIPEDADNFYSPLMEWVEEYIEHKKSEDTTVVLKLIYFNTSTSDYLVTMLKNLKQLKEGYQEEILDSEETEESDSSEKTPIILHQNGQAKSEEEDPEEEDNTPLPKHPLKIEWHYEEEDEDMRETGTHFESIIDLPFVFIAVEEID